eukprot:gnl/MRDRNA2_/MRDRNA2_34205_c0_seq1.p1 gnl/MRDRNA2_/MRDRNA2_34205_c0~~gnl/MRDRNA2_/MRDRNA2_34205_c0_seq1.p1  ORF type:complete len:545 (+),score=53.83 gnl/MRDRNA2_/MRDRNA2_34205_c0_seq1:203-1636(+)
MAQDEVDQTQGVNARSDQFSEEEGLCNDAGKQCGMNGCCGTMSCVDGFCQGYRAGSLCSDQRSILGKTDQHCASKNCQKIGMESYCLRNEMEKCKPTERITESIWGYIGYCDNSTKCKRTSKYGVTVYKCLRRCQDLGPTERRDLLKDGGKCIAAFDEYCVNPGLASIDSSIVCDDFMDIHDCNEEFGRCKKLDGQDCDPARDEDSARGSECTSLMCVPVGANSTRGSCGPQTLGKFCTESKHCKGGSVRGYDCHLNKCRSTKGNSCLGDEDCHPDAKPCTPGMLTCGKRTMKERCKEDDDCQQPYKCYRESLMRYAENKLCLDESENPVTRKLREGEVCGNIHEYTRDRCDSDELLSCLEKKWSSNGDKECQMKASDSLDYYTAEKLAKEVKIGATKYTKKVFLACYVAALAMNLEAPSVGGSMWKQDKAKLFKKCLESEFGAARFAECVAFSIQGKTYGQSAEEKCKSCLGGPCG